jgi:uncharacterized protein
MNGVRFAWDETKARENFRKHRVSFEEATTVFADENARLKHDPDHSEGESRFILLGFSARLRMLIVCHVCLENEAMIRIISARKATPNEHQQYGSYL